MSWKTAGKLVSGPPTASGSGSGNQSSSKRYPANLGGLNAFQREQEFASHYSRKGKEPAEFQGRTDYDVLKENHRFIRDDEEVGDVSWEERLARAYESKLFKEFALIDLKHYKSRRLALRWRTAEEVVEGIGEDTCASLRCKYHQTPKATDTQVEFEDETRNRGRSKRPKTRNIPALRAFELPFVYNEAGERKEALVKVRLCGRCEGNLTWRPGRKEESSEEDKVEKPRSTRRGDRKGKRREYGSRSRSPSRSRSRSRSPARREDREREEIRERRLI